MPRRFELANQKFWEIEISGNDVTTRFGKLGATGSNKTVTKPSPAAAKAAGEKLVADKLKAGYREIAGAKAKPAAKVKAKAPAGDTAKLEAQLADDPTSVASWQVYADHLIERGEPWGEVIAHACAGKRAGKAQRDAAAAMLGGLDGSELTWKLGTVDTLVLQPETTATGTDMVDALARVLAHPAGRLVRTLELGLPPRIGGDITWNFDAVIEAIVAAGPLPLLATIDMSSSAQHMDQDSWRRIGDLSKLWAAAPRLRELRTLGSRGSDKNGPPLAFGAMDAPHLEKLVCISGGLDKRVALDLGKAKLPALTHLELYFGREDYGCNGDVKSLAGILAGKGLPELQYLGLRNSQWEVDLVEAVAKSAILPRLKVLDLSLGILWNDGAAALVKHAAKFKHLDKLELHSNYLSAAGDSVKAAIPCAKLGSQKELDDDDEPQYRYCDVGE